MPEHTDEKTAKIAGAAADKIGIPIGPILEIIMAVIENCTERKEDFKRVARGEMNRLQTAAMRRECRRALCEEGVRPTRHKVQQMLETVRAEAQALEDDDLDSIYEECCGAMFPVDTDPITQRF